MSETSALPGMQDLLRSGELVVGDRLLCMRDAQVVQSATVLDGETLAVKRARIGLDPRWRQTRRAWTCRASRPVDLRAQTPVMDKDPSRTFSEYRSSVAASLLSRERHIPVFQRCRGDDRLAGRRLQHDLTGPDLVTAVVN